MRRRSSLPLLLAPPLFLPSPLPIDALNSLACEDARRRHPPGAIGVLRFFRRWHPHGLPPSSAPRHGLPPPSSILDAPAPTYQPNGCRCCRRHSWQLPRIARRRARPIATTAAPRSTRSSPVAGRQMVGGEEPQSLAFRPMKPCI